MKKPNIISNFLKLNIITIFIIFQCAKIMPPPGGPPDKTPPKLVKTIPPVKNYLQNNEVTIIFSEEIKKNTVINSFSIHPKLKYKLNIKNNKINIKLKETPEDSIVIINFNTQLEDIHNNKILNDILLIYGPKNKIPENSIKGKLYLFDNSIDLSKVKLNLYDNKKKIREFNFSKDNHKFSIDYIKKSNNLLLQVFYDKNKNNYCDYDEEQNIFIPQLNKENLIFLKKSEKNFSIKNIKFFCSRIVEITTSNNFKQIDSELNNYLINKTKNKIYFYYNNLLKKNDSLRLKFKIIKLNNEAFNVDTLLVVNKDSINISNPKFIYSYNDTIPFHEKKLKILCNIPIPIIKTEIIMKNDTIIPKVENIKNLSFSVDITKISEEFILLILNDSTIIQKNKFYKITEEELSTLSGEILNFQTYTNPKLILFDINKSRLSFRTVKDANFTINYINSGNYLIGIFNDNNNNSFLDNGYMIKDSMKYSEPITILNDTLKVRSYWIIEGIKIK